MSDLITTPFGADATAVEILEGIDVGGKRFVVTGGASGVGLETARALHGAGGEVTVAVRNPELAHMELRKHGVSGVRVQTLDLSNLNSVHAFAEQWHGALHGLIANAGVMALPHLQVSREGWELQLATNYLGHFALTLGLRDRLFEANGARVVTVSSTAHLRSEFNFADPNFESRPYDRWSAYAQSKTADVLLAAGIANAWADQGVTANSLMPGWINTNLQRHLDDDTLRAMGALDVNGNRIEQDFFKTPAQGAATSVLLAASPLLEGVTGRYFEDNQEASIVADGTGKDRGVARYALDADNASRLWAIAEPLAGN